ncbi:globin domain-containing protein [Rhodovulum euryhalinum]|uniref:Nitric oxide dioxygenase n=1 Tax=Rhodovulum euryhalinum TaxID=35805 RepID=A0A4R2KT29_9RHOB|nr:globin domain-containing protein [Rhodovulum euryhalinum]TCO74209.1 nitric oxide dioxygenase [Rhodovulum euryhalinum]
MDAQTRKIVVESSGPLFAAKGRFAEAFYHRLFEIAPESRALFQRDFNVQKRMLMAALAMVVGVLGDRARLAATAAHLGRVHARHDVGRDHFALGQRAFDLALQDFFGAACTEEMRSAWQCAYCELLDLMQAAPGPVSAGTAP